MTSLRHNGTQTDDTADPRAGYLDAARACLLDVGWKRTTLTEVARRAGVSRMTIYRTWADMPTLLGDLMTREWAEVVDGAVHDTRNLDSVDALVGTIVRTVRLLRENELFVRIVEVDPELILPYLLSRRGRSQDHILGVTVAAIEAAQAEGTVRAGNPVALARGLVLTAHGFVLSAHTMVDEQASEAEIDAELTTLLTKGLLT